MGGGGGAEQGASLRLVWSLGGGPIPGTTQVFNIPCPAPCPAQLGGFIGDWAAKRYPNHGRAAVAQFSAGLGVPPSVLLSKACDAAAGGGLYCCLLEACPPAHAPAALPDGARAPGPLPLPRPSPTAVSCPSPPCSQALPYGSSGSVVAIYGTCFTVWGLLIRQAVGGGSRCARQAGAGAGGRALLCEACMPPCTAAGRSCTHPSCAEPLVPL